MLPFQSPRDPLNAPEAITPMSRSASDAPNLSPLPDTVPLVSIKPSPQASSAKVEKLIQQKAQHALARGDPDFTDFYKKYQHPLYAYILQSTRDVEDTYEIVQDIFVDASRSWRTVCTLEERAQLCWLYTTARRRVCDHFRALKRRIRNWTHYYKEPPVEERHGDGHLEYGSQENERVWQIMGKLSRRERECLVLYSQGWSSTEIAKFLKIKESCVRGYITRGKKKYIEEDCEMRERSG